MNRVGSKPVVIGRVWSLMLAVMLALTALPIVVDPATAQGSASIVVNAFDADGVTPLPFARIQVTASDGNIYTPRETGLSGTLTFPVELDSEGLTFLVEQQTPPACGVTPEPQTIGPLADGESATVNFVTQTDPNCTLGTIAVYHYSCPDGFDTTAPGYEVWRDGCTEEENGVQYQFTSLGTGQQWQPVTGQWGIAGRAPIVGLPIGQYSVQEQNPTSTEADAVFYCLTYSTPNYVTSPNPSSIDRVDAPGGVATISLNNNRVSCDVFKTERVEEPDEPQLEATEEPTVASGNVETERLDPIGTATTTSDLNLRANSDPGANVLALMPAGSVVDVLGPEQNGFLPVRFQDQDGWAGAQFLQIGGAVEQTATSEPVEIEPTATPTEEVIIADVDPVGEVITNSDVNLRTAPSLDSEVTLVLQPGTTVDLIGESQNGFAPIRYQGQSGWASEEFLSAISDEPTSTPTAEPTEEDPTATATVDATATPTAQVIVPPEVPVGTAVTTSEVNLRDGASSNANILLVMPGGAAVDVFGEPDNGFYPVRYQEQLGWVSEAFLDFQTATETPTPTETSSPTQTAEPTATATDVVPLPTTASIGSAWAIEDVNMRSEPNGSSAVVLVIPGGDEVSLLGPQQNGFSPVRYQGQDGWVSDAFLSLQAIVQPADQEPATIELHKSVCDAGYVPGPSIYADCHEDGLAGITFFISGPNDFDDQDVTVRAGGAGPGIVVFDQLEPGTYTINEDVPGDFTSIFVYCSMADSDEVVPFTNNDPIQGIDINLAAGMSVVCDWYNIPDDQGGETGTASVELHKAVCEPGYVPGPNIFNDCHGEGLEGVTFFIEGSGSFSNSAVTDIPVSPGPGIVSFSELDAGSYTIWEDVPGDFTSIFVYCSLSSSDQVVPFVYNGAVQGIDIELAEGMSVICDWYNIPDQQETGTVEVLKRTCPVGYDDDAANFNAFYTDCVSRTDDIEFTLTPLSGTGASRTTGSDGAGRALFTGLRTGGFTLSEDLPGEFVTRYAYCGPDDRNLSAVTVVNGAVPLQLTGASPDAVCLWFNVPEDLSGETGYISLSKYLCPEGTTASYYQKCSPSPLAGATFQLDGPGANDGSALTNNLGQVLFDDLPAGNYTITEIPPANVDVAVYVVACQAGGAAYKFTYDDSTGMRIKLNLPVGGEVHCNWYNIPKPKEVLPLPIASGQGTITVHKFLCTGKPIRSYDWNVDCVSQVSPEGFSLSSVSGTRLANGTTNPNGKLIFIGLANGSYKLDETTGDWCHAEADLVDAGGNVIVRNGGNTDVYIYNCGARQVGTLPVTGSGDTASQQTETLMYSAAGAIVIGLLMMWRRLPLGASIQD
ncbi:hypothetical protein BH23CHL5_BH23CHL5_12000 [soil metagenome]